MTYGYMRAYEVRVRRAVNTPNRSGRFALWQGGMETNILVGSPAGVAAAMERAGEANQLGREFGRLGYTQEDADGLFLLEPVPRTVRGADDLLSVALQYGTRFCRRGQAAALRSADFFGNIPRARHVEPVRGRRRALRTRRGRGPRPARNHWCVGGPLPVATLHP